MSKIKSKRALSLIVSFLVIFILFFSIYAILSNGINIQKLSLGKITVQGLYLKLDNKPILELEKLDLQKLLETPNKKPLNIEDINNKIRYLTWGVSFFQKLYIKDIVLDPTNTASILFDGKQYNLSFPDIEAKFNIQEDLDHLNLEIVTLFLKKFNVDVRGKIVYIPTKNEIAFNFKLNHKKHQSEFYAQGITNLKKLSLKIKSSSITSLNFLKPYLEDIDNKELKNWLFQKVFFDSARIDKFNFETTLTHRSFLSGIEKSLDAKVVISAAEVTLFNDLDPIRSQEVIATFQNKKLTLQLDNPTYGETLLNGSRLEFENLFRTPKINIFIKSQEFHYSSNLLSLLKHYNIEIPIQSLDSPLSADLRLSLQFLKNHEMLVGFNGGIKILNSNFTIFNIPLYSRYSNIIFDITPQYKYIYITANDTHYYNMLNADLDGVLDLEKHTYKTQVKIFKALINTDQEINFSKPFLKQQQESKEEKQIETQKFDFSKSVNTLTPLELKKLILSSIKEDEAPYAKDILYISPDENITANVEIDFSESEDIRVDIPDFDIKLKIQDDDFIITLNDFSKISTYSPMFTYLDIKSGSAEITTSDFKDFDFLFTLENLTIPLYDTQGKVVKALDFSGFIKDDVIQVRTLDKNIIFNRKDSQNKIQVKGYNFNMSDFFESKIPAIQQALHGDSSGVSLSKEQVANKLDFLKHKHRYERQHNIKPQMTNIEISDMKIYYKEYTVPTEEINIRFRDQRILGDITYKNGIANLDFIDGDIYIKASNFSGDFVNSVIQKDIFNGGLFTLVGAYKNKSFNGELKIQNTTFGNFVVLQNIINLIDTVPSLIVFKNPNLGARGYQVSQGSILFGLNQNYLGLEKIHLVGDSMDIDGNGIVQLDNKEMNINLKISTIKNFSNILSKIPIVGYLVLGDEGKISTNLTLNGTLENPKTEISLAEDVITAPFNILRRIFTPIDLMVDEIKNEIKDDSYRK
ncbi:MULTISPECIES: DUF3971 domain-containing protein [unclassified Helicobacter]|uniref:DUF3971 domain-containing protein n=1 Tax=unclassified Helicobacter TaxID=2593540 RepID=UPI000CF083EB|nr:MULTISPECIES: DUF3971 domain-containing protein [unclassified Helicobacter]